VGTSSVPKKRKVEKGRSPRYPTTKKRGVGGFHKAGLGRNPTTKNSRDADTLPTNADKFTISATNLL
jgi:hypothetical protein